MKALILAAGYATRLYPLTINNPKPLLPINGRPIIDYIVDEINTIDVIDKIYVISNHKFAGHFEQWAETVKSEREVVILDDMTSTEETKLGAVGDIQFVIESEKIDDELMIAAGDNYFTFKLKEYYDFYRSISRDCVCAKRLDDVEMLKSFAVASVNDAGKIMELVEKPQQPKSDLAVYATYIYKRDTVPMFKQYLEEGNKPDAPGYFVQWLYKRKDVYAYIMNGDCYDIGTPKAYEDINKLLMGRNLNGEKL